MTISWVEALTFVSSTVFVAVLANAVYHYCFRYQIQLDERFNELSGSKESGEAKVSSVFRDLKQLSVQTASTQSDMRTRWLELIEQSGLELTLGKLGAISGGLAVVLSLLLLLPQYFLTGALPWWSAPIAGLLGLVAPTVYVQAKRGSRIRRLCQQLPEAFDVMSRAIRAGQTVPAALQVIANDFEAPISDEFSYCYEQQNLGMPMETALRNLARRAGVMELRIFVVALLVQGRSGGNLVELLNSLSEMTRKRLRLHAKVLALTGEGRLQANVLMVLPFVAFAGLLVISPNYAFALFQHPRMLIVTGIGQCIGCLWIRRIVNIEY